ncbi:mandelate racemase/muconate lactonizing enzyme family protein [Paenibacillus cymbidii]|uniref:mandelate racemase/muconate lactonizing enzyme family protein n=1 Tax=Paenibacillus cymbidii TaxID=1639034 RepID=UPI001081E0EB|nr:mandelate racemase/muconate lactonizing enzyme family protein [Paenibacillus cymbidii]
MGIPAKPQVAAPGNDKIVKLETFRWKQQPNIVWVEVTTEQGFVGLGETYYVPGAVEAVIHEMAAPLILGKNPFHIEDVWNTLFVCANFFGYAGAEMRAYSAIDIALWDIFGQATGLPVHTLLGGKTRDSIPIYNTCINFGKYTDMDDSLARPGELAEELLAQGIKAMKLWPWDRFAPQLKVEAITGPAGWAAVGPAGSYLSLEDLKKGLWCVEDIRHKVGDRMEIMIEGHSRWDLNCAIKIGKALEPLQPFWMEDMMQPDSPDDLARLADSVRVPQCVSERLFTRYAYRQILERKAAHIVILDLVWTGGLTEGRKIAHLADTYHLPIAPHDGTGPVTILSSMHLCASVTNAATIETERAFYDGGYYSEVVTNNLPIRDGRMWIWDTPGLGTELRPDFKARADVSSRITRLS